MDSALAPWLALREPVDAASRSTSLTRAIADAIAAANPVRVLDLATGTGSNLRYLLDRLPGNQHWLVVDHSSTLLEQLLERTTSWGARRGYKVTREATGCMIRSDRLNCRVETRQLDLDTLDPVEAVDPVDTVELFAGRHLVTASALLDLVSERWLRSLAAHCREAGAAALFTITYDGRSSCTPVEPDDEMILDLFNRHQRTDKGLGGAAAGPDAAVYAARCFEEAGYQVGIEPSDWTLRSEEAELQRQLIAGWAVAATEIAPGEASTIERWRARRIKHVDDGISRVVVGHHDLAAWLPGV